MKKSLLIIISLILLNHLKVSAQESVDKEAQLQETIENLTNDKALSEAVISICARRADGKSLVDINAGKMVMPASNLKLISTGAALHSLGHDYCFKTYIGHDGKIIDGILKGNLYIIGGGDPTLGSKDSIATSIEKVFAQWEKIVRDSGIRRIEGKIIGDGRHFEGMPEHPSWLWSDIGTYYGSGATGLMFYENTQSFVASPGMKIGDPVNITPSYPRAPWMEFRYNCTTGEKGTGDQLYMYTSDLAPVAEIRGTFGLDRAQKRVDCSNKFPEYTCASYFADHLRDRGIASEGPADFRLCTETKGEPAEKLVVLGATSSPSLKRIAFETNHASNNLYAEALFRSVGKEKTGSACYDSSYVALSKVFVELGINVSKGIQIVDGSGLSRQNYVSAGFICDFLAAMMASPCFESYLHSLPSPGSNGTLAYNMRSCSAETKARIKVKSGSMNGVRCYSGYIIPSDGSKEKTIIFSIMVNNCISPTWKIRPLSDKIMEVLSSIN